MLLKQVSNDRSFAQVAAPCVSKQGKTFVVYYTDVFSCDVFYHKHFLQFQGPLWYFVISGCGNRPTQSVMYVLLLDESVLLIVQYRFLKSFSGDFYSPESDPPHKIMRYWFYYSIWLDFSFQSDRICHIEMICIGGVPVSKIHFGGASP